MNLAKKTYKNQKFPLFSFYSTFILSKLSQIKSELNKKYLLQEMD